MAEATPNLRAATSPSEGSSKDQTSAKANTHSHNYVPQADTFKKFDGVAGCKITTKNKHMPDYKYIYPMLDKDGKVRLVTEQDFHTRITYRHRAYHGYQYLYPALNEDTEETELTADDLEVVNGWDERTENTFVPDEVERMSPLGIFRIRKSPYTDDFFIMSNRGDIYYCKLKQIVKRDDLNYDTIPKPPIRMLLEVNGLTRDVDYSPEQLNAIDEWRARMEELNSGHSFGSTGFGSFGAYLDPSEWCDDSIEDFFAANYPEEEEDEDETKTSDTPTGRDSPGNILDSSMEEEDSGYVEKGRKASCVSQGMSVDSFLSDELKDDKQSEEEWSECHDNDSHNQVEGYHENDDEFHDCETLTTEDGVWQTGNELDELKKQFKNENNLTIDCDMPGLRIDNVSDTLEFRSNGGIDVKDLDGEFKSKSLANDLIGSRTEIEKRQLVRDA